MKPTLHYFLLSLSILFIGLNANAQDTLVTKQFDMDRCVNLYTDDNTRVVRNREALDSVIRNDASRDFCLEQLKDLDLNEFSLLGINLNSGYCRVPAGLKFTTTKLDKEKKYVFEVNYDKPFGVCRALSSYDLWVQVPSIPDNYTVEFIVTPVEPEKIILTF